MRNLIGMNPAEIEEMRVVTKKRWELGAPPGVWRLHEDAFAPDEDLPEWAKCINGDIEFQRTMGAFKCDDCGMEVGHNEFYCPDCKKERADKKKLEKKLEERCKTLNLMTSK